MVIGGVFYGVSWWWIAGILAAPACGATCTAASWRTKVMAWNHVTHIRPIYCVQAVCLCLLAFASLLAVGTTTLLRPYVER